MKKKSVQSKILPYIFVTFALVIIGALVLSNASSDDNNVNNVGDNITSEAMASTVVGNGGVNENEEVFTPFAIYDNYPPFTIRYAEGFGAVVCITPTPTMKAEIQAVDMGSGHGVVISALVQNVRNNNRLTMTAIWYNNRCYLKYLTLSVDIEYRLIKVRNTNIVKFDSKEARG